LQVFSTESQREPMNCESAGGSFLPNVRHVKKRKPRLVAI
jgi:hypothetical protein